MVDLNSKHNVVSIDSVGLAKTSEEDSPSDIPTSSASPDEGSITAEFAAQLSRNDVGPREYVVSKLVDARQQNGTTNFRVHCYQYTQAEHTWESVEPILQHFVTQYWHRKQRAQKQAAESKYWRVETHHAWR